MFGDFCLKLALTSQYSILHTWLTDSSGKLISPILAKNRVLQRHCRLYDDGNARRGATDGRTGRVGWQSAIKSIIVERTPQIHSTLRRNGTAAFWGRKGKMCSYGAPIFRTVLFCTRLHGSQSIWGKVGFYRALPHQNTRI